LSIAVVLAAGGSAFGQSVTVPLRVDFGEAAPKQPVPVRGGVPFAKGVVPSAENVRLLADGREAVLQARTLAVWPDGSVKWLLLDFEAAPGGTYALEAGGEVSRGDVPRPLDARAQDDAVVVNTGRLHIVVRRGGTGFLDEVSLDLDGDGTFAEGEAVAGAAERGSFLDFVHLDGPEDFVTHTRRAQGVLDRSELVIDALSLEEAGPLHAVVLMRGHYRNGKLGSTIERLKRQGLSDFTLRLHAYRGHAFIEAQHSFTYEGDPDYDFVRQVGLVVRPHLPAGVQPAVRIGMDGATSTSLADAGLCGIVQESADNYRVWETANGAVRTVGDGQRAPGWLDVSGPAWGVTVGIRDFWQRHAKSVIYDPRAGEIRANVWAPEAGLLDVRRYSRAWGVGETGAQQNRDIESYSRLAAKGVAVTSRAVVSFHAGSDPAPVLSAPVVIVPPEYVSATQVLGAYHAANNAFPDLEAALENTLDYWLHSQELFGWYGIFDYGDFQQWYNRAHPTGRWDSDFGRWGWANNDGIGRISHTLMLQFLRTGERRYFDAAAAMCSHHYESDMVHTTEYPWDWGALRDVSGCVHRHNAQHWGCPYIGLRGASPMGARIYYYLTGDGRIGDILDLVLDAAVEGRFGHSGGTDGLGTAAYSYLIAWERTGEAQYGDKLRELAGMDIMRPQTTWQAVITTSFGLYHGVVELHDLSGDETAEAAIRQITDIVINNLKEDWTYPDAYFRIVADGYRLTGDGRYRERLLKMVDKFLSNYRGSAQGLPREQWPGEPGMAAAGADFNALRDMPYVMEVLGQ
jgi:hypothetical protein